MTTKLVLTRNLLFTDVLLYVDFSRSRKLAKIFRVAINFIQAIRDITQLVVKLSTHLDCSFKLDMSHFHAMPDVNETSP